MICYAAAPTYNTYANYAVRYAMLCYALRNTSST
jgi:hypothetical protein